MNRFSAFLVLVCSTACIAQAPQIKSGATVYIEPMGGYETYLAAAFTEKQVPLIVVADKDKAEYIIQSNVSQQVPAQPAVVVSNSNVNNNTVNSNNGNNGNNAWNQGSEMAEARRARRAALGSTNASISVIDAKSSQVVFAYSVDKHGTTHQSQSAAEACAKHLKEFIEKSGKRTTASQSPSLAAPSALLPSQQPSANGNLTLPAQSIETMKGQATNGDAEAQTELAAAYFSGNGVPQDYTKAVLWFRKGAEQGNADAQYVLGEMYSNGQGVPMDDAQAAVWWRMAAEQGIADAQSELGYAYSSGQGLPKDYAQAMVWWHKAAEQGDAKAQLSLGMSYSGGFGVPKDYAEAYFWLDIAAAGNLADKLRGAVVKYLDDAASHLTPADLSRVQERARKWFEDHPAKPQ